MSLNLQPSQVSPETWTSTSKSILNFPLNEDILKTKIIWTFRIVETKHCSSHSNETIGWVFHTMLPDSEMSKKFTCGKKTSYLAIFGFAPYLMSRTCSNEYVLLFNESLNKIMEKKLIDIHVRLWVLNNFVATSMYCCLMRV